ncbi:MAG: cyclic nucleotide-binding domain-containing protein [Acidobacteria bacterium]|nr:cyclic nucleotide-binding domain-containing protein [Acidobacteriota bacterium]
METLSTLDKAIRLQKVELFSNVETDVLALAASIAAQIHFPAGTVLFKENGSSDALYVLLEGKVQLTRGNREISTMGPGETLGKWALFDDQPSMATATCAEDTWLLKIEREDFFDLLADHAEMTQKMFTALVKRMRTELTRGLSGATKSMPNA